MITDLFDQSKYIYIVFPHQGSGNHLTNLLSLLPGVEPRFSASSKEDYQNIMVTNYKKIFTMGEINNIQDFSKYIGLRYFNATAHLTNVHYNLPASINKHKEKLLNCNNKYLFCCHLESYVTENTGIYKELKEYPRVVILQSQTTSKNQVFLHRQRILNTYTKARINPNLNNYDLDTFYNLTKEKENVILFDSDTFLTYEGFDYLQEFVSQNFNVLLPISAKEMHDIYIGFFHEMYDLCSKHLTVNGC